uniref:Uncharacterized protein n=1 Tax=Arion vulgaris TaxID=1028688 RepID=A0A0B6ZMN5_9EUPU
MVGSQRDGFVKKMMKIIRTSKKRNGDVFKEACTQRSSSSSGAVSTLKVSYNDTLSKEYK